MILTMISFLGATISYLLALTIGNRNGIIDGLEPLLLFLILGFLGLSLLFWMYESMEDRRGI